MKSKIIYTLIVCAVIGLGGLSAYAADEQVGKDETTVLGACMIQKINEKVPGIKEEKINQCSDAEANAVPKCLGMSDDDYLGIINFCKSQLTNAKCVAKKMKVSLYDYADCGYEKDPEACYKALGFTIPDIMKLSKGCIDEGAK